MRAGFFESAGIAFAKEKGKEREEGKQGEREGGEEGSEEMICTNTGTAY